MVINRAKSFLITVSTAVASVWVLYGCGADMDVGRGSAPSDGLQLQEGFISTHYDEESGRLLLEVSRLNEEFLYVSSLASGLGAPRGVGAVTGDAPQLDRGQLQYSVMYTDGGIRADEAVVRFERQGSRLLLLERNLAYRSLSEDEHLSEAVAASFPQSVLGAFPIVESAGDGRFLVDATAFFLADVFDVQGRMRNAGVSGVRLDPERSYIKREYTKSFPKNTEIRAALTFTVEDPPASLRRQVRDARSFVLEKHHSFVELPPAGFTTRKLDLRVGNRHLHFWNFSQGFNEKRYRERFIHRFRLEKRDPDLDISEPVNPIVLYMDPAMPEPYRTAFWDSTLWWNEAFEGAGFRNAVEVRELPAGADPMDIRYSMIQFVHRSGQGTSTAPHVIDPRTGEILKAMVRLDSHRSLHSYNLYAALRPAMDEAGGSPVDAEQFAMSARHWHAVHEVGHTLGFEHNFLGGTLPGHSMMDYRPARYQVDEQGGLDMSEALRDGLGRYDHLLVHYAYTPFDSPEEESAGLEAIVSQAYDEGIRWLSNEDATLGGSVPQAHRWIEGADVMESLERNMAVRSVGLEHFDERAVRPGQPMWLLANRLTHVYFHHIYHLDAVTKYVGGQDYTYTTRGDGQIPTRIFPAEEQIRALELVLSTLSPEVLAVPERITQLIPPVPFGHHSEDLYAESPTGLVFDPLTLARTFAHHVVQNLLHPQRAARLVSFHARDSENPSLNEVISRLLEETWGDPAPIQSQHQALRRITQRAALEGLFRLAVHEGVPDDVRALADEHLVRLGARLRPEMAGSEEDRAHQSKAVREIDRYITKGVIPDLKAGVFDLLADVEIYTRWP